MVSEMDLDELELCASKNKSMISDLVKTQDQLKTLITKLSKDVSMINNKLDSNEDIYKLAIWWIVSIAVCIGLFSLLFLFSKTVLSFLNDISAWATTFTIFGAGIYASIQTWAKNRFVSLFTAFSCAALGVCYLAYVLIDFGGAYPNVSAIAFNFSTLLRNCVLVLLCYNIKEMIN